MIKGDMILTKPGQGKNNQKVTFVQKQVLVKSNDLKNMGLKKQLTLPKGKFFSQAGTKFFTTKDGKLVPVPITTKAVVSNVSVSQIKGTISQLPTQQVSSIQNHASQLQQQPQPQFAKVSSPTATSKMKSCDLRKEKRKPDGLEVNARNDAMDSVKTTENKLVDG